MLNLLARSPRRVGFSVLMLALGYGAAIAQTFDLDAVATTEAEVELTLFSPFLNSVTESGSFGSVQTSGDFVATYTFIQEMMVGFPSGPPTQEVTVFFDRGSALEQLRVIEVGPRFASFELFYFPGCTAPSRCGVPLVAILEIGEDGSGDDEVSVLVLDGESGQQLLDRTVPEAVVSGSTPTSFDFVARQTEATSPGFVLDEEFVLDFYFGYPEAPGGGVVRALRFDDGRVVSEQDITPATSVRKGTGIIGAGFGASVQANRTGLCVGQTPSSPAGSVLEGSVSVVTGILANLGAPPELSTAFGKFPLGENVQASGTRCGSANDEAAVICDGACVVPTVIGAQGQPGFGRSLSLAGQNIFVGGGSGSTGAMYQYVVSAGARVEQAGTIVSSNPEFGSIPLQATGSAVVTTLSEEFEENMARFEATRLLRLDGVTAVLFGSGFEGL